jgi:hypothetical protein
VRHCWPSSPSPARRSLGPNWSRTPGPLQLLVAARCSIITTKSHQSNTVARSVQTKPAPSQEPGVKLEPWPPSLVICIPATFVTFRTAGRHYLLISTMKPMPWLESHRFCTKLVPALLPYQLYITFIINCLHHTRRCEAPAPLVCHRVYIYFAIYSSTCMLLFQANNSHDSKQFRYKTMLSCGIKYILYFLSTSSFYTTSHVRACTCTPFWQVYVEVSLIRSYLAWCQDFIMLMSYTVWKYLSCISTNVHLTI